MNASGSPPGKILENRLDADSAGAVPVAPIENLPFVSRRMIASRWPFLEMSALSSRNSALVISGITFERGWCSIGFSHRRFDSPSPFQLVTFRPLYRCRQRFGDDLVHEDVVPATGISGNIWHSNARATSGVSSTGMLEQLVVITLCRAPSGRRGDRRRRREPSPGRVPSDGDLFRQLAKFGLGFEDLVHADASSSMLVEMEKLEFASLVAPGNDDLLARAIAAGSVCLVRTSERTSI